MAREVPKVCQVSCKCLTQRCKVQSRMPWDTRSGDAMHYQFDATLKDLLEEFSPDYLAAIRDRFRLSLGGAVRVIDADVSTISASADKVCLIEGPPRLLLDLEPQSGPDAELPERLLKYSVLLTNRHKLRVRTAVLAPEGRWPAPYRSAPLPV